jgi:hypothetical protein
MNAVGVRELRQNLSRYLAQAWLHDVSLLPLDDAILDEANRRTP